MNLFQLELLKAKGYNFLGTNVGPSAGLGTQYISVAIKDGKIAAAGHPNRIKAERRLVQIVTDYHKPRK